MVEEPIRVLFVDDTKDDFLVTQDLLANAARARFTVDWAGSYTDATLRITEANHDVYILCYDIGEKNGIVLLEEMVETRKSAPFIILTHRGDVELEHKALKAGASAYLVKDEVGPQTLERAILQSIERTNAERQRHDAETNVLSQQKLESLSTLAGAIAHDFNNLLTGIVGNASLLLGDLHPGTAAFERVRNIEKSVRRAEELTSHLLAFSRKTSFKLEKLNLSHLVADIARLIETSLGQHTHFSCNLTDVPPVEADATQIRQAIVNVIMNAADSIDIQGGSINITTGTKHLSREDLDSTFVNDNLPEGYYIYMQVSDTGCGMDEETLQHIFDPFYTTKGESRGLGLAGALGIVRSHKGTIQVDSQETVGTTVTVYFPHVETLPKQVTVHRQKTSGELEHRGLVLVVDDEHIVQSVARSVLEREGYQVITALDGVEGVRAFQENHHLLSLVILDMTMPNMTGDEAFVEMRSINSEVPVVISSGYFSKDISQSFENDQPEGILQKPYEPSELIELADELLGNSDAMVSTDEITDSSVTTFGTL